MSLQSYDALLLDVFDLQEQDRIVTFLTAERGKKRGVARGARRKHSRFAGQLQPLARARVTWFERPASELVRVRSLELSRPATFLQGDLEGLLLGTYLADHMMEFAQENEASHELFRLLDTTLEALAAGIDRDLAGRYYEIWVLRLAGVFPSADDCLNCGRDLGPGAVLPTAAEALVCRRCGGAGLELDPEVLELLRRSSCENLEALSRRPPSAATLAAAAEVSARVRRSFLQHELKSFRVIRETLAGLPPDVSVG
jgi:DNA repair protein RecO (recombination protein O)